MRSHEVFCLKKHIFLLHHSSFHVSLIYLYEKVIMSLRKIGFASFEVAYKNLYSHQKVVPHNTKRVDIAPRQLRVDCWDNSNHTINQRYCHASHSQFIEFVVKSSIEQPSCFWHILWVKNLKLYHSLKGKNLGST